VKCNPNPELVNHLAQLGCHFDCATPAEIDLVVGIGVDPSRIIYANPCKRDEDIRHAIKKNVHLTTFDSVSELQKIALNCTTMDVVMRIRADDPTARCALGNKYGAEEDEWDNLLTMCSRLSLNLVGISFHVGSMAKDPQAFVRAIEKAKKAVDRAEKYSYFPRIIDIGGGFSSTNIFDLGPVPSQICQALNTHFPSGFQIIAEPGRYFAEHVVTLVTPVIGIKTHSITISESLYGAFNCMLFDHATPEFSVLNSKTNSTKKLTMFGSTCDGGDIIYKQCEVPDDIACGQWIVWNRMGAYTSAATTSFNGIPFHRRQMVYLGLGGQKTPFLVQ
jgi:ornithine decarboxylase